MSCQPATPDPAPAAPARASILLVEDEVLIRFALADYLRESGHKVYEAHNGEEAIQFLSFYRAEIDVVFADIKLPGTIDGLELARWVKKNRPEAALMLTSGNARTPATDDIADIPYFAKPCDLKAVRTQITTLMQRRRQHG
jgi:DNA-binding response OmpR family regulator